jgi:hypothetical protein
MNAIHGSETILVDSVLVVIESAVRTLMRRDYIDMSYNMTMTER